mmetsp:Transcript_27390/g.84954  ORF Transcript_27390/g.84954 Transcript_27390/m.84954 type:complete len:100 (+) Transcript_27390:324-623(+)
MPEGARVIVADESVFVSTTTVVDRRGDAETVVRSTADARRLRRARHRASDPAALGDVASAKFLLRPESENTDVRLNVRPLRLRRTPMPPSDIPLADITN